MRCPMTACFPRPWWCASKRRPPLASQRPVLAIAARDGGGRAPARRVWSRRTRVGLQPGSIRLAALSCPRAPVPPSDGRVMVNAASQETLKNLLPSDWPRPLSASPRARAAARLNCLKSPTVASLALRTLHHHVVACVFDHIAESGLQRSRALRADQLRFGHPRLLIDNPGAASARPL